MPRADLDTFKLTFEHYFIARGTTIIISSSEERSNFSIVVRHTGPVRHIGDFIHSSTQLLVVKISVVEWWHEIWLSRLKIGTEAAKRR
jgi:hypothetical protein